MSVPWQGPRLALAALGGVLCLVSPSSARARDEAGWLTLRLGGGPIWFRAPDARNREQSGTFEATAGFTKYLFDDHLLIPIELGYARDWGQSYGGHLFVVGGGLGLITKPMVSVAYVPRLVLGSRDGLSGGIRHGVRLGFTFFRGLPFFQIEAQHQALLSPAGGSSHLGVVLAVDLLAPMIPIASGRPLHVGDERSPVVAALVSTEAWAV